MNMTHNTHNTVITDASSYDERCTLCGATDRWRPDLAGTLLDRPCPMYTPPVSNDESRLECPKNPKHQIFEADVVIKGEVLVSRHGEILSSLVFGPDKHELTLTESIPLRCGVCQTPL